MRTSNEIETTGPRPHSLMPPDILARGFPIGPRRSPRTLHNAFDHASVGSPHSLSYVFYIFFLEM